MNSQNLPSSFRDPSGFLFSRNNILYRQINVSYKDHYNHFINSGCYQNFADEGLIIPHAEVGDAIAMTDGSYKVIQPEMLPFISHPYEWSFSQLKEAALFTLRLQRKALHFAMVLKDASSYNVQFTQGKTIFIDTLSLEKYQKGTPWVAYKQFCQHFLAPLSLMAYKDVRLSQLLKVNLDGIPLDLASRLLPLRTRLRFSLFLHIHAHAKSQRHFSDKIDQTKRIRKTFSLNAFQGLISSLESAIKKLKWDVKSTEWSDYYEGGSYTLNAFKEKQRLVLKYLNQIKPAMVWDFGANTGMFSRIASDKGINTISFDSDPGCVEKNYIETKLKNEVNILPLWLDLTNPSPDIGWQNSERLSLIRRGPADVALALALLHHLAISNNVPLSKIADFFSQTCRFLIIEFVPKNDVKVQQLLATRKDIFPDYTRQDFEFAFNRVFAIQACEQIGKSGRILYLMKIR